MATRPPTAKIHPDEKIRLDGSSLFRIAVGIGVVLLVVATVLGNMAGWSRFFHSYLVAYSFFLTIALGALFFTILQHLVGAVWSVVVRRLAEIITQTFPLLAVLYLVIAIPPLMDKDVLYSWVSSEEHLVHAKQGWLNAPFFLIRGIIYFAVWIGVSRFFYRRSVEQDDKPDPMVSAKLRKIAAPSMFLFAFTTAFAGFDLLMSLHPAWYSTMFGVYFFAGCCISIMATLAVFALGLQGKGRLTRSINVEHYHDIGKWLFAWIFFWAYVAFSQFMLIWYADLPEETAWYRPRIHSSWNMFSLTLLFGHWAFPFVSLLTRQTKRHLNLLLFFAFWMLLMHYIDLYWLVMPEFSPSGFEPQATHLLMDLANVVGIGGLFVGWIAFVAQRSRLIPVGDPRLGESLAHECSY